LRKDIAEFGGFQLPVYSLNTLIVGSGAAALSAALELSRLGQEDIAVATDRWGGGASNNAGSDKQTYYKLSLCGDAEDSPLHLAEDLFAGGSMHGDIALCEAQNSVRAFLRLVELGVPFPHDRYGAYPGYKTDHDPRGRATSAGPLTSRLMFENLAREVKKRGIPVLDRHQVVALIVEEAGDERQATGAVALDLDNLDSKGLGIAVFNARNIVLGTGGPGGIYRDSVYPEDQLGSTGMALEAGAIAQNLTESQFGIASTKFRWNLSGTYQQVIPRYVSTDKAGGDEREFLNPFFPNMGTLATAIFLKGYQWPFDPAKVAGHGSSLIDLLVYRETVAGGRRVFLDYTGNPSGGNLLEDFSFDLLSHEARDYLEKSAALFGTPIQRLAKMNPPAADLFWNHGIDLYKNRLEIAVCAQHNNGGLLGNAWWESNVKRLFPVGEVNGSHGVRRPGGSALNAGQVGALRAAAFIAARYGGPPMNLGEFLSKAAARIEEKLAFAAGIIDPSAGDLGYMEKAVTALRDRMSHCGAHVRDPRRIKAAAAEAWKQYAEMRNRIKIPSAVSLPAAFRSLDLCLTHAVYLEAINEYMEKGGKSRGSYLVLDPLGEKPNEALEDDWRFGLNAEGAWVDGKILEIRLDDKLDVRENWVDVRPIPREEHWFEKLWLEFRDDRIIR
jgi:succinate dehydrogenase/fumarate reductase flavoprotein subunit